MKTLKALAVAIPVGIGLIGCGHSLADPVGARAGAAKPARLGSVYMFRGLFGTARSIALDQVAAELTGLGVKASIFDHSDWRAVAETIKAQHRGRPEHEPIILVGYSMGGYSVIQLSRELGTAGIPVDLLVALDPAFPPPVPANVARAVGLYQTRAGFQGSPVQADAGFSGELVVRNLGHLPGVEHRNFKVYPAVRREVVARVLQVARPRSARPGRAGRCRARRRSGT